jgi:integrase
LPATINLFTVNIPIETEEAALAEHSMPSDDRSNKSDGLADISPNENQPTFLVLTIRTRKGPYLRPVLVIGTRNGEIAIPREPVEWMRFVLQYQHDAPAKAMLTTIGRLYEYASTAFGDIELTVDTLPTVVWNYIAFRVGDRTPDDLDSQNLPLWNPVKRSTALSEFRTIVEYLRFCDDKYKALPLLARRQRLPTFSAFEFPSAKNRDKRDFFRHLRGHRERYRKLLGIEQYYAPRVTPTPSLIPRRSAQGQTMPRDDVDLIISAEKNLSFKALWILLAFGGIRVSEAMNLYCVDIMPGSMIGQFEKGFTQQQPLIVLADPIQSRFIGDFRDTSRTRLEYLSAKYGLIPRPNHPDKHPLRAGWKGMMVSNENLLSSWVYWSHPEPARKFLELTATLLNLRRQFPAAEHHPYFFINVANDKYRGQMLKYSNIVKAFERACQRIDLEPHVAGRTVHGFRDFFKDTLQHRLKLPPEIIQVMMHHTNISSQQDYGHCESATVHEALSGAYARADSE